MIKALDLYKCGLRPLSSDLKYWGMDGFYVFTTPFADAKPENHEYYRVEIRPEPLPQQWTWKSCYRVDELEEFIQNTTYYEDLRAAQRSSKSLQKQEEE